MPIDRNAFFAGGFRTADLNSTGKSLSYKDRLEWNFRMTHGTSQVGLDKTFFSARKFVQK